MMIIKNAEPFFECTDKEQEFVLFARQHGDAGKMVNTPNKVDVVLISAMLEIIGRIENLEAVTDKKWE